jgi:hypothetical protein
LIFLRDATLMAQPFDPAKLELSGDPVPIAEGPAASGVAASAVGAPLGAAGGAAAAACQTIPDIACILATSACAIAASACQAVCRA